jgi:hypothetical protein
MSRRTLGQRHLVGAVGRAVLGEPHRIDGGAAMSKTTMTFEVGQRVVWHKVVSAYGHVDVIPVTIRKIGASRITVEVPLNDGGTRLVVVKPENLRPMAAVSP